MAACRAAAPGTAPVAVPITCGGAAPRPSVGTPPGLEEEPVVSQIADTVRKPVAVVSEVALVAGTLVRLVLRSGR